jgi:hypothetical protein
MAELRCETTALNEVVADLTLENRLIAGMGRTADEIVYMKNEIMQLIE